MLFKTARIALPPRAHQAGPTAAAGPDQIRPKPPRPPQA